MCEDIMSIIMIEWVDCISGIQNQDFYQGLNCWEETY